ncbi:putative prefoldin subunit 5 [Daldinia childiae]|uniref:putative prefoldin subunit 5 n=1 Tax=Daldinia childiae TaxID=326645 RepID=UPI0014480DA3|nr:putative prefoldin subunit 5 [Daldinia childiae]KAF3060017.1 putative prefoldin subunit 5 [Daldinia childiae]
MASGNGETINLDTLSAQQLSQVKKQLDEELEHLTSSFTQLHAAQSKFRECLRCVQDKNKSPALRENNAILVPLTNSLYVRGTLADASHVVVDIGTGFYVEKDIKSAADFYENKVGELGASIKDLEVIVQGKTNNVRVVEEVANTTRETISFEAKNGRWSAANSTIVNGQEL